MAKRRWTPDQTVWVHGLAWVTKLCPWERDYSHSAFLSTRYHRKLYLVLYGKHDGVGERYLR